MFWIWVGIGFGLLCVGAGVWMLLFPGHKDARRPKERVRGIPREKYSTSMTSVEAARERIAARRRRELLEELDKEQVGVITTLKNEIGLEATEWEQEHHIDRLNRKEEQEQSEHLILLATNHLNLRLIEEAGKENYDVPTYLELRKKADLDRLDLDKQWKEAEQQLKAGFIYNLQAHQHLALMTEYIGKLYDRAEALGIKGKYREQMLIEEHITFMEEDFRGRQRLLQASNREDVRGSDQAAIAGGDDKRAVEEDTNLR